MITWLHTQKHPCKIVIKISCKLRAGINCRDMYWADLLTWIYKAGGGTIPSFSHSSEALFYRKLPGGSAYPADIFVMFSLVLQRMTFFCWHQNCFFINNTQDRIRQYVHGISGFYLQLCKGFRVNLIFFSSPSASLPRAFIKTAKSETRDQRNGRPNIHFLCSPYCQIIQWLHIFYNPQPQHSGMS